MRRMRPNPNLLLFGVVAVVLVATTSISAQQPLPREFTDTIQVQVLNLEAVVTDRDGAPVTGLARSEFRVLVDGEQTPIEYFSEIRDGRLVSAGTAPPQLAEGEVEGQGVSTSLLIFIDEFFAISAQKDPVIRALVERVDNIRPSDRVAVVAWDGKDVTLLTDWTSSSDKIRGALQEALSRPGLGLQRTAERRSRLGSPAERAALSRRSIGHGDMYRLGELERTYADLLSSQLQAAGGAVSASMRGLDPPPGRRVMLLLSGGWPWDPAQWTAGSQTRMISEATIPSGAGIYSEINVTANLLGYSVYAVDVPGLQSGSSRNSATGLPAATPSDVFFLENEIHRSLEFIADATGGRALLNAERINALPDVGRDMRNFYWLGITPTWTGDNEFHEISIEISSPDLRIRYRNGYTDLSREAQVAMSVESALLFGKERSSDAIHVELGEPEKVSRRVISVPLTIAIDVAELTTVLQDGQLMGSVYLVMAVRDDKGGRADVPPIPLMFALQKKTKKGAVTYQTNLQVRRNTAELAIAVYDRLGDKTLTKVIHRGE